MQGENDRLSKQKEIIEKVTKWLRDEAYEPEEVPHTHPDVTYFAKIRIDEKSGFHIGFSVKNSDNVPISKIIAFKQDYQKAYASLSTVEQNRFFFDLKLGLLQMNVLYNLEKGVRQLESIEVFKPIYFDGLTKDKFFDTVFTVHNAIEIARIKLGQFRDRHLPSQAGLGDNDDIRK